jgi:hypothetical protein
MKKVTWADIDEEEREKEEKKYVPPHKKESPAVPLVETVNKKAKLPHGSNPKKL